MQTYRIKITMASPSLTAWQADTLFGHLCWALVRREGEAGLHHMLDRYRDNNPPLILSDGFPDDLLPRPLLPAKLRKEGELADQIAATRRAQEDKRSEWYTTNEFSQSLQGGHVHGQAAVSKTSSFYTLHNQVNRASGTTGGDDSGHLFSLTGEWTEQRIVYIKVADDCDVDWRELLNDLQKMGFGKRKSVGYGAIESGRSMRRLQVFHCRQRLNGFVSLSSFVPAKTDPIDGYWKTDVKYGKLGEERAVSSHPFKYPLVRILPGAVFHTSTPPKPFYGRLVEDIAPQSPDVVQYGFAFVVPIRID